MTNRILVTGATGFVGRHAVSALIAAGIPIRVLVRDERRVPASWPAAGVEVVLGALEDNGLLRSLCRDVGRIWHLAGLAHVHGADEALHDRVNRAATLALAEAAAQAGVRRFVHLSSSKAVGDSPSCQDERSTLAPTSAYGRAKRAAELGLLALCRAGRLQTVSLRPPLVYGPGVGGNLGMMLRLTVRGLLPPLPASDNRRSLVGVEDLVRALFLAGEHPAAAGKVYFLSDGEVYSTARIQRAMALALGRRPAGWTLPRALLALAAFLGDGAGALSGRRLPFNRAALATLLGSAEYDSRAFREELGFRPQQTLESALPAMLAAASRV